MSHDSTDNETTEPPCRSSRPNIMLAITGSVAAIKGPELAVQLVTHLHANVKVLLTKGGNNFWSKAAGYNQQQWDAMTTLLNHSSGNHPVLSIVQADDEWKEWNAIGDPVLHIDLRDWADVMVIAPLSAHTLAKLSNGLCDDTLSCVVRAWDFGHGYRQGKPLLLVPAMNTAMWEHPLTQLQLTTIQGFWNTSSRNPTNGVVLVSPQVKTLACGEIGNGAMAAVIDVIEAVEQSLHGGGRIRKDSSEA